MLRIKKKLKLLGYQLVKKTKNALKIRIMIHWDPGLLATQGPKAFDQMTLKIKLFMLSKILLRGSWSILVLVISEGIKNLP
jgi:hypothetical protein